MTVTLRPAQVGEEDELGRIGQASFQNLDVPEWTRFLRDHTQRVADDTLCAEIGGAIVGHATALSFSMRLDGTDVPMRGISAVAVLPEYRRRGVADALMRGLLRRMRERGQALSLLYPFSMPFYRKFGYATCEWIEQLRAPPRHLPDSLLRAQVRPMHPVNDVLAVRAFYEAHRGTGSLARSEWWWERRVFARAPRGVLFFADGALDGYLLYDVPAAPGYPQQHLLVKEFMWRTPSAFRGLLGFLEALGEQYALVELNLPRGAGGALLADLMQPPDGAVFKHAGTLVGGAMARLVDVPAAFALRALRARGALGLDVDDPVFGAQSWDVSLGAAVVEGADAPERLALGVDRLAQIYFGGAPARTLLAQGLIAGSERAATLIDEAFAGPPLSLGRMNFF